MRKGFRFTRTLVGLVAAVLLCLAPLGVSAASNSLAVNPRRDYTIKPGDKVSDTLYVQNLSKTDALDININVVDFGPKDETGSPSLFLDPKTSTRWSLKPYLTIAKSVQIPAGKSTNVPFTIAIPKNVGAGSYYSAIKYSSAGDSSGSNVTLTSSSATLVFVRVPGEANDALLLKNFGTFTPDASGTSGTFGSFYGGEAPKYLAYRLTNNGNVAEQPTGSIAVKNIFGHQVKLFQNANPDNNIVLIGQTRRFDLCMNEQKQSHRDPSTGRNIDESTCNGSGLAPGRYTAQLGLIYGDNGSSQHELRDVASFWYLPVWFVLVVIAAVLVLAVILWLLIRLVRGNHRHFSSRR